MIQAFAGLSQEEQQKLVDAIAQITILIAGADGNIDNEETEWAEKLTKIRSYASDELLNEYYLQVGDQFEKTLSSLINDLPDNTSNRNSLLSDILAGVNAPLSKLDPKYAAHLYKSYVSFAEHVAKASGGVMRFFSVSSDEKKWMNLPMINAIEMPVDDEGEEE